MAKILIMNIMPKAIHTCHSLLQLHRESLASSIMTIYGHVKLLYTGIGSRYMYYYRLCSNWQAHSGLRISILFFFGSSLAFGREIRKMYSEVFSCLIRDSSLSLTLIGRRETCLELNKRKPHCTSVCLLFNSL